MHNNKHNTNKTKNLNGYGIMYITFVYISIFKALMIMHGGLILKHSAELDILTNTK